MEEIWRDIEGYEGLYQVSSQGRVRTLNYKLKKGCIHIMKQAEVKGPYNVIELSNKNRGHSKRTLFYVHRLVCFAFPEICGEYFEGAECNHKDENGLNNSASNLEWVTPKSNNNYGTRIKRSIETKNKNGKRNKPVNQYDIDGIFIKRWDSATIAANELGLKQARICRCCLGQRNHYKGFIWRYVS